MTSRPVDTILSNIKYIYLKKNLLYKFLKKPLKTTVLFFMKTHTLIKTFLTFLTTELKCERLEKQRFILFEFYYK